MPVGTAARSKYLSAADYEGLGAEIVLGNTYHLMLRPGAEVVARFGGSARSPAGVATRSPTAAATRCSRSSRKVDDDGVTFRSVYDGSTHRFTPESAVATQELLGADIQMVLDVCPPLPSPPDVVEPRRRPHRRLGRARPGPPIDATTKRCSASSRAASTRTTRPQRRHTAGLDFDGYGIGGLQRRRDPRRDAARPRRQRSPTCRPTGRAT